MEQLDKSEIGDWRTDFRRYFYFLWSWAWLIALVGVVAGGTAYFFSKRTIPIYMTTARLLVNAPSTISGVDPSSGSPTVQSLAATYAQMLMDRSVLQGVITQLKLERTPEDLAGAISVQNTNGTQLLEITVRDPDPQRAADIANAVATVFVARVQELRSQRYASIRGALSSQISDMEKLISTTSDQVAALEEEMAASAAQKAAVMGTQLAVEATQTVSAMQPQPAAAATQTVTAIQQQLVVAATQTALAAPPTVEPAAHLQLQSQLTQYRTLYANLVLSYQQVRMAEEQASSNVVVSQEAPVNTVPVRAKSWQNPLFAALLGILAAAGIVLGFEKLNDTIQSAQEIERDFRVPILGVIVRHHVQEGKLVTLSEPGSLPAEAFRTLRANLRFAAVNGPLRRILVTSPAPQDGKTTVASNLSVALSQDDTRVILVDADLRKPKIHSEFGLENGVGLTELFMGSLADICSSIQVVDPLKLAVLTSGGIPPNPAELLGSQQMAKILDTLNQDFGMIVVDTPPVLAVADAALLAASMDGVLLVVKPGKTRPAELKQALQQLRAAGAPVLGVVVNDVNRSNHEVGYHYNTYYSSYSHKRSAPLGLGRLFGRRARRWKQSSATPPKSTAPKAGVEPGAAEPEAVVPEPEVRAADRDK